MEEEEEGGYELAEPSENAELRLRLAAFPAPDLAAMLCQLDMPQEGNKAELPVEGRLYAVTKENPCVVFLSKRLRFLKS